MTPKEIFSEVRTFLTDQKFERIDEGKISLGSYETWVKRVDWRITIVVVEGAGTVFMCRGEEEEAGMRMVEFGDDGSAGVIYLNGLVLRQEELPGELFWETFQSAVREAHTSSPITLDDVMLTAIPESEMARA